MWRRDAGLACLYWQSMCLIGFINDLIRQSQRPYIWRKEGRTQRGTVSKVHSASCFQPSSLHLQGCNACLRVPGEWTGGLNHQSLWFHLWISVIEGQAYLSTQENTVKPAKRKCFKLKVRHYCALNFFTASSEAFQSEILNKQTKNT